MGTEVPLYGRREKGGVGGASEPIELERDEPPRLLRAGLGQPRAVQGSFRC